MPKLVSASAKENYILELIYDDGLTGEYSCADLIEKEEFAKLKDVSVFNSVTVNPVTNDVFWDKNTTLCHNALHKYLELQRLMKVFKIDVDEE